jgi:hypothetical protein
LLLLLLLSLFGLNENGDALKAVLLVVGWDITHCCSIEREGCGVVQLKNAPGVVLMLL